MKIELNPDKDYVAEIKKKIRENNNYCPCRLNKTPDTKCMCKEFRDMVRNGEEGMCHCGLYVSKNQ